MVPAAKAHGAVIIASEPLSTDPGWQPVQPNHLVIVDEALNVTQRAIRLEA